MMKNLRAKLNKQGGFTLIEMLIVVAIIAILIAIAIPAVNKALERAREATDSANERAAIGLAMVEMLSENKLPGADGKTAYYQVGTTGTSNASVNGTLVADKPSKGFDYGKGTAAGDINAPNAGKGIMITYVPADPTGDTPTTEDSYTITWTN